jgi:HSP20 family molecular chaperone IbpA
MAESREVTRKEPTEAARAEERFRAPAVDIYETEDGVVLLADMPGVTDDGLDVSVDEGVLTMTGQVRREDDMSTAGVLREYEPLSFRRVFSLSSDLSTEGIEGRIKDGVLRLTIPKAEEAKVKRIQIKSG